MILSEREDESGKTVQVHTVIAKAGDVVEIFRREGAAVFGPRKVRVGSDGELERID